MAEILTIITLLFGPNWVYIKSFRFLLTFNAMQINLQHAYLALRVLQYICWQVTEDLMSYFTYVSRYYSLCVSAYSQVPIKRVGPNKRVGWIFIKYFCLSLCLFLTSSFFGAKWTSTLVYLAPKSTQTNSYILQSPTYFCSSKYLLS